MILILFIILLFFLYKHEYFINLESNLGYAYKDPMRSEGPEDVAYKEPMRSEGQEIDFKKIDIIYYINLDHRTDRNEQFLNEMKKINFPSNKIKRISAIENNNGSIGCSSSHVKTLDEFINSPHNICIIFEDDFEFYNPININLMNKILNHNDFDIICLSANDINSTDTNHSYLKKINNSQTTSGYIVTKKFAKEHLYKNFIDGLKLLKENQHLIHIYSIDQYWKLLQPDNKWFVSNPKLGKQRESYSDILKGNVNYELFN